MTQIRTPAAAAAIFVSLALAAPAPAAEAPEAMKRAFGNTIISTYPDGRTALLWIKADGTYSAKGRRRLPSSGTWKVSGQRVCLKQTRPRGAPIGYCTAMPSGESWSAKAVTGEPIKVRLVRGIVES